MLNKVIQLVGVNITIVGNWIWIDGETYPHKSTLKEFGFKWAHEKRSGTGIAKLLERKAIRN